MRERFCCLNHSNYDAVLYVTYQMVLQFLV